MNLHDYETETRRIEKEDEEFPQLTRFVGSPEDSGELPSTKGCDWSWLWMILALVALTALTAIGLALWRMYS